METQAQLTIEPAEWSAGIAPLIAGAVTPETLPGIRAQVAGGRAELFAVRMGGRLVGAYVLRVDDAGGSLEGVIVAAAGLSGFDWFGAVLPAIERQFVGVDAYRIHTARPGLVKKLAGAGWVPQEFVMRKAA